MKDLVFFLAFGVFLAGSVPVEEETVEGKRYAEPEELDRLLREGLYDEFSELMGIDNPRLAMPRNTSDKNDPAFFDPSFIKDLFEGDVLLTPSQEESARAGIIFSKYPSYRWPGRVAYTISSKYTTEQVSAIEKCIQSWNAMFSNCIIFVARTNEQDYVFFFPADGCYANLGKVGGQQPISLATGCFRVGTIHHEMMHTCGILHEQCRPDRDSYVQVLTQNIPTEWQSQYEKESASVFATYGPYECGSAMHYPPNAPVTNKPAFSWINGSCPNIASVGQRTGLTTEDQRKCKIMYGCQ